MQLLGRTPQIAIIATSIDVNSRFRRSVPVQIKVQSCFPALSDITVCAIQCTVGSFMPTFKDFSVFISNQAADSFNSVELGRKTAVRQVERMTLLTLQVRISLTDKHRILIIEIRIQIPDTRTPDTHIISTTQILRLS